jgi:membrane fusion protein, multidrug efflux system
MLTRWNSSFVLLLLAVLVAGTSLSACGTGDGEAGGDADSTATTTEGGEGADEAATEESKPQRAERAVTVTASTVESGDLVVPVNAEGRIRARRNTELQFELAGRIARIRVEEGQRVRRGQILASLDNREYEVALEEAHSNYLQALGKIAVEEDELDGADPSVQKEFEDLFAELDRMERAGTITREERRRRELALGVRAVKDGAYRTELLEVRSGLAAARAEEARAELNLEKTVLRAPFDGVVSGLILATGERVQVGDLLCSVVDDVDLEAEIGVLESDLASLEVGGRALLDLPALHQIIPAIIAVISPEVDTESRTCQVLLRIRSEDGRVKPGMFVRASLAGEIHRDKLIVPRIAILTRSQRPMLFKIEEGRSRWVYVELGAQNEYAVEIKRIVQGGPLEPGTQVVTGNHLTLTHDAKVKVRKVEPIKDPWSESESGPETS